MRLFFRAEASPMNRNLVTLFHLSVLLLVLQRADAQGDDRLLSVKAFGGYTTAARLLDRPDAADPFERNSSRSFDGMFSGGVEVGMPLFDDELLLFVTAEYGESIRRSEEAYAFPDQMRLVSSEEGIRFIPVELGAHVRIPMGSEVVRLSMGGGIGFYHASRILRIEGQPSHTVNTPTDVNIFVDITFGYRLASALYVEAGVRFRDPETVSDNRFDPGTISRDGVTASLPTRTLPSHIIVDGMRIMIGLALEVR